MNRPDFHANGGWVNIYQYSTGRIHAGTGVYTSKEEADDKARHKNNRVACVRVYPGNVVKVRSVPKKEFSE